jgi:ATP-binding cassette subfamily F protein uup
MAIDLNILSVESVAKSFGARVLFNDLTFGLSQGEKVALIAKNGTGKTSLLDILAGLDKPDSGIVTVRRGTRVGFLQQDPKFDLESTVLNALFLVESPTNKAIKLYEMALLHPENGDLMEKALAEMEHLNAWDAENNIKLILTKLNLTDFDKKVKHLSGGQLKRLALAQILIEDPDVLILDEPTNHLDLEMIEWLEVYLKQSSSTLLMVTHDRYFLESICGTILELDDNQLYRYAGNYSYYLEKKHERIENQKTVIAKAKNLFTKELAWMRSTPQARTTKAKYRIDAFKDLKQKAKQRISDDKVELDMQMERLGSKIVEMHKVKKAYGDFKILDGFDYTFMRQDRIGIVGRNGVGKSTFIKMMTGQEPVDSGKIIVGETIKFGYFGQQGLKIKADKKVIDVVKEFGEYIPLGKGRKLTASQLLERFLFDGDAKYTHVSKLSGGEKRRLYLLTVLIQNPNFLILDEPTNDLDLLTLNVLEEFLLEYPGCLIIISHDRFLLDKLTDHLFVLKGDGVVKDYPGTYLEYKLHEAEAAKTAKIRAQSAPVKKEKAAKEKTKRSFKEETEFNKLSEEIESLENRKIEIAKEFETGSSNAELLQKLSTEINQLTDDLDEKEMRWLELSELGES